MVFAEVLDKIRLRHTGDLCAIADGNAVLRVIAQCYGAFCEGQRLFLRHLGIIQHRVRYGYEPWHIRYIDDAQTARDIMSQTGMTLEVWLGAVEDTDPVIDYGSSTIYSETELEAAAVQIKCKFAAFAGCSLHSLRYAGDACNSEENVKWLSDLDGRKPYIQVIEFLGDFHSPVDSGDGSAWEPDTEYTDYQWWLAREEGKGWQLLTWGY